MMDIKRELAPIFYILFDKETSHSGIENENMSDHQLAEELHKQIIGKFKKRKVYSFSIDNIQGVDLANTQLISKFNKGNRFLLCVIDVFSKYAWVISLKYKKGITITNAFPKMLDKSNSKPNKI